MKPTLDLPEPTRTGHPTRSGEREALGLRGRPGTAFHPAQHPSQSGDFVAALQTLPRPQSSSGFVGRERGPRAIEAGKTRPFAVATLLLGLVLSSVPAFAELPEPDTVFLGTIALDNAYITAADTDVTVELRRTQDAPPLASYRMGNNAAHGDRYVLRARVESGLPLVEPDASLIGSTVWLTVSKAGVVREAASQVLSGRGRFVTLNFGDLDTDGDGIRDGWEQTYFGSPTGGNPNADPDGDYRSTLQEFLDGTDPLTADGRHPADAQPADWQMTLGEVTRYASAWLRGDAWPTGPQPADSLLVDFVTAAGTLWLGGEAYVFDNDPEVLPPLWWTHAPAAPALAKGTGDAPKPRRALAAATATPDSVAKRASASAIVPGQPVTITLAVEPNNSVNVYAVEERLPDGWTIQNVTGNGVSIPRLGQIRWGPFFDHTPRVLTYVAVAPASLSGRFTGVASYDGNSHPAVGLTELQNSPEASPLTVRFLADTGAGIEISGPQNSEVTLEMSTDLRLWTRLDTGRTDERGLVRFSPPQSGGQAFFRAVLTH